jgi:predicted DNA-binding protein
MSSRQYTDDQLSAAAAAFAAGDVTYHEGTRVSLPPAPETEPMVPLGIRVPPALAQRIRVAADQAGVPYSQLVREWIELGLTEMAGDLTVSVAVLRRAIAHAAQSGHAA